MLGSALYTKKESDGLKGLRHYLSATIQHTQIIPIAKAAMTLSEAATGRRT